MKTEVKDGNLIITMPLTAPRPSKSGKTLIVASTSGFVGTEATVDGKSISVSINAVIPK